MFRRQRKSLEGRKIHGVPQPNRREGETGTAREREEKSKLHENITKDVRLSEDFEERRTSSSRQKLARNAYLERSKRQRTIEDGLYVNSIENASIEEEKRKKMRPNITRAMEHHFSKINKE